MEWRLNFGNEETQNAWKERDLVQVRVMDVM